MSINRSSSAPELQPATGTYQTTTLTANKNGSPSTPKYEATTKPATAQTQNSSSYEIQPITIPISASNTSNLIAIEIQPTPDPNKHSTILSIHDQELVNLIDQELNFVKSAYPKLEKHQKHIIKEHDEALKMLETLKSEPTLKALKDLKKIVTRLKLQIPVKQMTYDESNEEKNHKDISSKLLKKMPKFHEKQFHGSPFCKARQQRYHLLRLELKLCLLCFSVFPENAIISRRLMVYWWIGEGFVPIKENLDAEMTANNFFKELMDMDFIEPVSKRHGSNVAVCKMHPMVRATLVMIADKVKFFDFDEYGNPKDFGKFDEIESPEDVADVDPLGDPRAYFNFFDENDQDTSGSIEFIDLNRKPTQFATRLKDKNLAPVAHDGTLIDTNEKHYFYEKKKIIKNSYKVCLMGSGLSKGITWEKVYILFNVKDDVLEFKPEWFLKMKYVNVVFLGRWQSSAAHHIEGEEFKFEESLKHMKNVKLFSLQGVSGISELPKSISNLENLLILDLRSCYNLHVIPKSIGSLKYLTHLDMSECYLLEHMPIEISSLKSLQVLKGFVVIEYPGRNTCTLNDLQKLENLRKLSMYTHMKHFPQESHLEALQKLEALRKLTILWGGHESQPEMEQSNQDVITIKTKEKLVSRVVKLIPRKTWVKGSMRRMNAFNNTTLGSRLEKLDLKCYPDSVAPNWLTPGSLQGLKKLYIRGGKFSDLGQYQDIFDWAENSIIPPKVTWNVEVLRLKYLEELKMEWTELQSLFPKMTSLEKVKCPRLTLFPCNERGVWIKKTTTST